MELTTQSEQTGGPAHSPNQGLSEATARLIREQVRTVMQEEMRGVPLPLATLTPKTPDARPPPAYNSDPDSTPNGRTSVGDDPHSEAAHLLASDPLADVEADDAAKAKKKSSRNWAMRLYWALPDPIRGFLVFLPVLGMIVLIPVLCIKGDFLNISVTAFLMLIGHFMALGLSVLFVTFVIGYEDPEPGKPKDPNMNNESGGMTITLYLFLTWALFTAIMWQFFVVGNNAVVARWLLAGQFDAKVTQHHALQFVTECLQDIIPDRNATIDDFTVCLRKLGMPKTIVP